MVGLDRPALGETILLGQALCQAGAPGALGGADPSAVGGRVRVVLLDVGDRSVDGEEARVVAGQVVGPLVERRGGIGRVPHPLE